MLDCVVPGSCASGVKRVVSSLNLLVSPILRRHPDMVTCSILLVFIARCTYNSCGGVREGTKPRSLSTRGQVRCPAVEKLASLQRAPGRLHVETWAGRGDNSSLWISQEMEIIPGCADTVVRLPSPSLSSVSPGRGREVRNWLGWTPLEKTAGSGVWGLRGALVGSSIFFALVAACNWVMKGPFLRAWAVLPLSSCSCSYAYGRGTGVGPIWSGAGHCWPSCGGLSFP